MKFDSNQAWRQASSAIAANREVLLALAGVFFLLPSLALGLLLPPPEGSPGMSGDAAMKLMQDYYVSALPFIAPMALVQAAGTLALLTLFTDRTRPTVGAAIRQGLAGILPYILAQLLLGVGIGLAGALLLGVAAATGAAALTAAAVGMVAALAVYVAIRTSLSAPVIAVEGERNAVAALKRSWALTRGNAARIGVFYLLVGIAFLVVMMVVMAVAGVLLALVGGKQAADIGGMIVSSAMGAAMTLYFAAIMAAVHRQLAGPSPEAASAPFE